MSLRRRLRRLESSADTSTGEREREVGRETLRRLTDADLVLCEKVLVRQQAGEEPTEEERRFLSRYHVIREEMVHDLAQTY